jgi:hypothetical protein
MEFCLLNWAIDQIRHSRRASWAWGGSAHVFPEPDRDQREDWRMGKKRVQSKRFSLRPYINTPAGEAHRHSLLCFSWQTQHPCKYSSQKSFSLSLSLSLCLIFFFFFLCLFAFLSVKDNLFMLADEAKILFTLNYSLRMEKIPLMCNKETKRMDNF